MDHDTRTKAATEQDPKLAGRIVRSLKQVEDDAYMASGPLSERLMSAIVQSIKQAVPEPFNVVETDWTASITAPDWKATRGVGQDFSLTLAEIGAEEEGREYSWLTAATAIGPTRLGIEFSCRPGLREAFAGVVASEQKMAALYKAGFVLDVTDGRLFVPIVIAKLADAFEKNDLSSAMAPVTKAVQQVVAAKPELDKIAEAIRVAAKVNK